MRSLNSILDLSVEELDQLIQFVNAQFQNAVQTSHALPPLTAR